MLSVWEQHDSVENQDESWLDSLEMQHVPLLDSLEMQHVRLLDSLEMQHVPLPDLLEKASAPDECYLRKIPGSLALADQLGNWCESSHFWLVNWAMTQVTWVHLLSAVEQTLWPW